MSETIRPNPPQEEAPNLELMEGVKNALMTFMMYHYQALRMAGYEVDAAKDMMGEEISSLYDQFARHARMDFKPDKFVNPHKLLDEIIADTKSLGTPGKAVHQKLLDFKRLIK